MSILTLRFPVLVRVLGASSSAEYAVRPLLAGGDEARNRKYARAMADCLKWVRREWGYTKVDRESLDGLLWYRFDPILTSRTFELSFSAGRDFLEGHFLAVWFEVGGNRHVCLPGFDDHLFIARPGRKQRYDMEGEVQRVVQHLLREERRRYGDEAPDPKVHLSRKGDFVTSVTTSVGVANREIAVRTDPLEQLIGLFGKAEIDGGSELSRVGEALNWLDEEDRPDAHGREELIDRLHGILYESRPSATVLVGPSGVGKTTLIHAAVHRYLREHERSHPVDLQETWRIDPTRLISGMSVVGQWQRRCEAIFKHLEKRLVERGGIVRKDILYFDNPVALLRVGKSSQNRMVVADVLKPYLEKGAPSVLAECTAEAWNVIQDQDRGFADLFRVVRVPEPEPREALEMIIRRRADLERRQGCRFDHDALHRAIELGRMYGGSRAMPARVVDFLGQLAARHAGRHIELEEVDRAYRAANRISGAIFDSGQRIDARELDSFINERLIGQEEASVVLTDVIHTIKARLTDPEAPAASLLFIGPTGVGKTEAAKVLAEYLFDDPQCLVRFDMNEFVDASAAGRLVGDFQQPEGQLTARVRQRPFCLLLLDEIEKADPSVHDLLLQLLGEGRLTDSVGRTTDFSNCVVVMTSNLGAEEAGPGIGFGAETESRSAAYRKSVEEFFRPELFNRIDRLVAFEPLGRDDLRRIARLQLARVLERHGFAQRASFLDVSDAVLDHIVELGFDPEMGARALKRVIEKEITSMAAEQLIRVPAGEPAMIHLFAREGRLVTDVSAIEYVEAVDSGSVLGIPAGEGGAPLYRVLLEAADEAHAELVEADAPGGHLPGVEGMLGDPQLLALREGFAGLRDRFVQRLEAYDAAAVPPLGAFPHHVRRRAHADSRRVDGWCRNRRRDILSHQQIRDFLEDAYQTAAVVEGDGETLRDCVDMTFLRHRSRCRLRGEPAEYWITVKPLLKETGRGWRYAQWLLVQYLSAARKALHIPLEADGRDALEVTYTDELAAVQVIQEEDASRMPRALQLGELYDCFAKEAGTHVFHEPYGNPIAVSVTIDIIDDSGDPDSAIAPRDRLPRADWIAAFERGEVTLEDGGHRPAPVVRVYAPAGGGQAGTVTDVRTGLICRYGVFDDQLPFWLYHVLPEHERLPLGGHRS